MEERGVGGVGVSRQDGRCRRELLPQLGCQELEELLSRWQPGLRAARWLAVWG